MCMEEDACRSAADSVTGKLIGILSIAVGIELHDVHDISLGGTKDK